MKRQFLWAMLAAMVSGPVLAEFPDKPVTLVVPFAAGGPTDKVARDLAEALRGPLGGTVTVENVAGEGGTAGATKVAKASADGYTLLVHHIGMATAPLLYRGLKFKPLEDFEYLGLVNEVPMTLVARPNHPANSWPELAKWLDGRTDRAQLAHAGIGSASHLCGLLFQAARKADLQTTVYKGTGPAMADLIAGKVDLMCDQTSNTLSPIEAGKVKAYAVTTSRRLSGPLAKLPTLDEAGLKGFNITIWNGVYAPKGTPKAVLDKLQDRDAVARVPEAPARAGRRGGDRCAQQSRRASQVRAKRDHPLGPDPEVGRAVRRLAGLSGGVVA